MDAALKNYFGFTSLRPYQKDVIAELLRGRDCLVVMATGGGKSMCYQLPPLITNKTSIVVSPLLSLMQDQVMSLNQKGIMAEYLGSSQSNPAVVSSAQAGHYNVVYMTPEKAMSLPKSFWCAMLKIGICLVAVDEAHCISEWGPNFRMEYKKLSELRKLLPGIPFVALTATATSRVRDEIKDSLSVRDAFVYIGSFDRPNLYYAVKLLNSPGKIDGFLSEIHDVVVERFNSKEATIIYCATICDTEQVHESLNNIGIPAAIYHGKMATKDRQKAHRSFITNEVFVMVATIAFGMGIDKPDVRCVIHYGCPKSLEGYYQESGRCGRDGLPSRCLLYYRRSDFSRGDFYCSEIRSGRTIMSLRPNFWCLLFIFVHFQEAHKEAIMRSFLAGQRYCCLLSCRRHELLNYFGQASPQRCGNCDNCIDNTSQHRDISKEAVLLMSCIAECGCPSGLNIVISVLRGSNSQKITENNFHLLDSHGKGMAHRLEWWKLLVYVLINEGYICQDVVGPSRHLSITQKGQDFLSVWESRHQPLVIELPSEMFDDEEDKSISDEGGNDITVQSLEISLCNQENSLYQMLLEARKSLAYENGAAPYAICSDQVLRLLAKRRPSTIEKLADVDGVNLNFINRFGVIVIHCIKDMAPHLNLNLDNLPNEESYASSDDILFNPEHLPEANDRFVGMVLDFVQANNGISFEEVASSFDEADHAEVAAAFEFLQSSFEIYLKDGLYFMI